MKNTIKRTLAAFLALAAVFALFTACGGGKGNGNGRKEDPNDLTTMYAYVPSYVTMPKEVTDISYAIMKGDKIFFIAYVQLWPDGRVATPEEVQEYYDSVNQYYNEQKTLVDKGDLIEPPPDAGFTYEMRMYSVNSDGTDFKELTDYKSLTAPEGKFASANVQNLTLDAQGNLCSIDNIYETIFDLPAGFDEATGNRWDYYVSDKTDCYIRRFSDTGAEISSVHLNEYVDESALNGYFYVYNFATDNDGNIYFSDGNVNIYVVGNDGALKMKLDISGSYIQGYVNLADGKVGASIYDYEQGKQIIKIVDLSKKTWGDSYEAPMNAQNFLSGSGQYDFCYNTGTSMFGYTLATETATKLITWLNSDIDGSNLRYCDLKDNGDLFVISFNYDSGKTSFDIANLVRKPIAEVARKQSIVFACSYLDYEIRNLILKFNRTDPDYRIEVRDYSEYNTQDDYNAGVMKLNTEIISGNIPDIIAINGLPINQYIGKGLLADLYPFIDNDKDFSRSDFVESVFKVMEKSGKLYSITNNFEVLSIAGKASVVGTETGWTMSEFQQFIASHPEADYPLGLYMTRDSIFQQLLMYSLDSYVNWDTGACSFDSEDFKSLLTFANSFPKQLDMDNIKPRYGTVMPLPSSSTDVVIDPVEPEERLDDATLIRQGRMLASFFSLYSFDSYQWNRANFGGDIVFKGVPGNNGGGNVASIYSGLALTNSCKNKDAAWRFMRTILTEDYQRQNSWSFPTNKNILNEKVRDAMHQEYDSQGKPISKGGMSVDGGETVEFFALTQAEIDLILGVINNLKFVSNYSGDSSLVDIITEEASAYFAGEKTVDEVAFLIQSRMKLYINEQR